LLGGGGAGCVESAGGGVVVSAGGGVVVSAGGGGAVVSAGGAVVVSGGGAVLSFGLHAASSAKAAHRETSSFVLMGAPVGCGERHTVRAAPFAGSQTN